SRRCRATARRATSKNAQATTSSDATVSRIRSAALTVRFLGKTISTFERSAWPSRPPAAGQHRAGERFKGDGEFTIDDRNPRGGGLHFNGRTVLIGRDHRRLRWIEPVEQL